MISELVRPEPEPNVIKWFENVDENTLYLSVLTLGEIGKGISLLPESKRKAQLSNWIDNELTSRFVGRILPVDEAIAIHWGSIAGRAQTAGKSLGVIDGLLAATAIVNDLQLVTRNVKDFAGIDLSTVNPWKKQ